jgi:hypothetical protein
LFLLLLLLTLFAGNCAQQKLKKIERKTIPISHHLTRLTAKRHRSQACAEAFSDGHAPGSRSVPPPSSASASGIIANDIARTSNVTACNPVVKT